MQAIKALSISQPSACVVIRILTTIIKCPLPNVLIIQLRPFRTAQYEMESTELIREIKTKALAALFARI